MIYTNNHRRALNEHLASQHPELYAKARPDCKGSLHLVCRELPKKAKLATDEIEVESMARAYHRELGWQMPVLIQVNNILSGELRHEYLVNYVDHRNRRDMREVERLIRLRRLF